MSLAFLKQHFIRNAQPPTASISQRNDPGGPSIADFLKKYFIRSPSAPSSPSTTSTEKAPARRNFTTTGNPLDSNQTSPTDIPSNLPSSARSPTEPASEFDLEAQRRPTLQSDSQSGEESSEKRRRFKVDARVISDAIIGLSDGLTVPFALTAGLSTLGDKRVVIFGGLAELIAGAISMGLGGYLGAKSEAHSYIATVQETETLISSSPHEAEKLANSTFHSFNLPNSSVEEITSQLRQSPDKMLSYLMKFHHSMEPPGANRAFISAATIASGYFFGGFLPLIPYFFVGEHEIIQGLYWSVIVMVFALFTFGYCKTCVVCGWRGRGNAWSGIKGGLQMVLIGGAAAGSAVGLVKAFNSAYK